MIEKTCQDELDLKEHTELFKKLSTMKYKDVIRDTINEY